MKPFPSATMIWMVENTKKKIKKFLCEFFGKSIFVNSEENKKSLVLKRRILMS
jgi:hypothetical protein